MIKVIAAISGYILGSIPFAYLIGKFVGKKDLTKVGSGSLGTTNVIRNLNVFSGIICLLLDLIKGGAICYIFYTNYDITTGLIAGFFAILGHCYSLFMKFKGGKGVATSVGVLLSINLLLGAIWGIIQFGSLPIFRKMSLSSLFAAITHPIIAYTILGKGSYFYFSLIIGIFVIFTHRANIKRIIEGNEKNLF